MRFATLFILVAILAPVPPAVRAQGTCDEYLMMPALGRWAEYQVIKEGEPEFRMRFAIVSTEQRAGRDMHWFELAITEQDEDDSTILKFLIPEYPLGVEGIEEVVMKAGDGPAMKIGGAMMGMIRKIFDENPGLMAAEECKTMKDLGEESVTVPAGTFATRHYGEGSNGAEVWASRELPFGLVKSFDGDEYSMELISQGDGARTAITETPQDLFGN